MNRAARILIVNHVRASLAAHVVAHPEWSEEFSSLDGLLGRWEAGVVCEPDPSAPPLDPARDSGHALLESELMREQKQPL